MKKLKHSICVLLAFCFLISGTVIEASASYSKGYPNTYSNTGNQALDIAGVAKTQLGYTETGTNHTKYNAWYYGSDTSAAWCAIFITWCARQAGVSSSVIAKNARASGYSTKNMGSNPFKTANSYAFGKHTPQVGDIVFIDNTGNGVSNHVGLITSVDSNWIYTTEGNYDNKVSQVKYSRSNGKVNGTKTTHIVFYAVPKYSNNARTTELRVWISDSKMGNKVTYMEVGQRYYLCYEIADQKTGDRLNTYMSNVNYSVTEEYRDPDGSSSQYTYSNSDNNWFSFVPQKTGSWKGTISISGGLRGTVSVTGIARKTVLDTWISDTKGGNQVPSLSLGKTYYTCMALYDAGTGQLYETYKPEGSNYTVEMTLRRPDKTLSLSKNNTSELYGFFTASDMGDYSFSAKVTGAFSKSQSITRSVSTESWSISIPSPLSFAQSNSKHAYASNDVDQEETDHVTESEEPGLLIGDVNGDGEVNTADAMLISRSCLSETHKMYRPLTESEKQVADVNNDGVINTADSMLISRSCLSESHKMYQELQP